MSRSRSERRRDAVVTLGALTLSTLALLVGCEPGTCVRESDCPGQTACRAGRCVVVDDAGPVPDGATTDVGDVGLPDAWSVDAPIPDVGNDASADDAGADDSSVDANADASVDASLDAGVEDASVDASVDASLDGAAAVDANADASRDDTGASADTGPTLDVGVDGGA